jgi:predicted DsbA family dithiol-disulfide isomerase
MPRPLRRVYFDFVDPISYVVSSSPELRSGDAAGARGDVEWVGFELRPPPMPLTASDDPLWSDRARRARPLADALGLILRPPHLVPWTRKAHELHVLAGSRGMGDLVREAIFQAYFGRGEDIGRVDVLVEVAGASGLDRTETKAVLDVDRHEADVVGALSEARALGVGEVPSASVDGRLVEGFPDLTDLGTLLPDA